MSLELVAAVGSGLKFGMTPLMIALQGLPLRCCRNEDSPLRSFATSHIFGTSE